MIYAENYVETVKSLTTAQLALGVVITVLQVITTSFDDNFHETVLRLNARDDGNYINDDVYGDRWGTGIWVGILIIFTASLGISGYRRRSQCLVITHLVFNAFVLLSIIIAITILTIPLSKLDRCREHQLLISRQSGSTTAKPLTLYNRMISVSDGNIGCEDVVFTLWRAFDGIILTSYLIELILTMIQIVFNSLAVCLCCRKCCVCHEPQEEEMLRTHYSHMSEDVEQSQMQPMTQSLLPNQPNMPGPTGHPQPSHHIINLPRQSSSAPTAM